MASYYYLISSLPTLFADDAMPMTYGEFLSCCAGNVGEKTYALLESLTLSSSEGPLVREWAAAYGALTKELNAQRNAALGKQDSPVYERDAGNAKAVSAALSAKNPLEAEQILLDYEFDLLDSLVGLHAFDDTVLFGYALKLKLMERRSSFDKSKGQAEFKRLLNQAQERIYRI